MTALQFKGQPGLNERYVRFYAAAFFLFLFPFYLWRSGLPQISDIYFAIIAVGFLPFMFLRTRKISPHDLYIIMFAGLTLAINLIHYSHDPDQFFFLSSLIYVYNIVLFIFFRETLVNYPKRLAPFFVGFFIFLLTFQILYGFGGNILNVGRNDGTFNNPNQLSYWCVIISCIVLILNQNRMTVWALLVIFLATVLIILSLSRTGMAIMAVIWLVTILFTRQSINARITLFGFLILIMFSAAIYGLHSFLSLGTVTAYSQALESRFATGQPLIEEIAARGFLRIIEQPHWMLVGAGEGGFHRFATGLEIHSGVLTILYSYGVLGFGLFLAFLFQVIKRATWVEIFTILMIVGFNVTHQSIRFSMFWIFLAFLAAVQMRREQRKSAALEEQEQASGEALAQPT